MPNADIRAQGEAALRQLDQLRPDAGPDKQSILPIMDRLVKLRDDLIAAHRAGAPLDGWLPRTNAILSALFGTEFPVGPLQWKRVGESRDALREMLRSG